MTIENIDIEASIEKAQIIISEDKDMSPASKSMFEILILIITLLVNRLNLNSRNSSKPPSCDRNRAKESKIPTGKKAGGQNGHIGKTLKKVDDPDEIKEIEADRDLLPPGRYKHVGFESRQVFDIDLSRVVTEYRAQVLEDQKGNRYIASFPEGVAGAVQYGTGVKAQSVYMSQFQMIPYNRVQDYFADQVFMPVSDGSIFNFSKEAYELLAGFEERVKTELAASDVLHADETGINMGGKGHWLHLASNTSWTYFYPHEKRGRIKRSKSRNLLERLRDFEDDVLRFMDNKPVPFSNNQGGNDIRMTKVQQKISGCFRSMEGAGIFCRVRSYLSTCRKHEVKASQALELLFKGKLPDFLM